MTRAERKELRWQKRIERTRGRRLDSFKIWRPWVSILIGPRSFCASLRFLLTAFWEYLAMQFLVKWRIVRIPVKHVDHALDGRVPFRPEKLPIYMKFIAMWLQPLSMLMYRNGFLRALPTHISYMRHIQKAYHEAGRVYHFSMTTTNRPPAKGNKGFRMIHIWDPHYLCVPSLHIIILILCFSFFRKNFEDPELRLGEDEKAQWNAELYESAVAIGESVLYVKQHSVNCLPAAMYMVTRNFPHLVTPQMIVSYIDDFFRNADEIPAEDRESVLGHIHFMYERFLLEGAQEDDWTVPVKRWLAEYVPAES